MEIDWQTLEDRLFDLAAQNIRLFASIQHDETFYGFAFDCNSEYGNVILCLNTPDSLRQTAIQYATIPPNQEPYDAIERNMEEILSRKPSPQNKPTIPEDEEKELRWSLGDWKYEDFTSKEFDSGWRPFERAVLDACVGEDEDEETFTTPTQDRFIRAACRVLVRLESAGVLDALNQTDDFTTYVSDHDESEQQSWDRLKSVRNEQEGA